MVTFTIHYQATVYTGKAFDTDGAMVKIARYIKRTPRARMRYSVCVGITEVCYGSMTASEARKYLS